MSFCLNKSVAGLTSSFRTGQLILYCVPQTISNPIDHHICKQVSVRCSWGLQSVAMHPAEKWHSAWRAALRDTMGWQVVLLWNSKTTRIHQVFLRNPQDGKKTSVQCWDLCEDISILHPLGWIASCHMLSFLPASWMEMCRISRSSTTRQRRDLPVLSRKQVWLFSITSPLYHLSRTYGLYMTLCTVYIKI